MEGGGCSCTEAPGGAAWDAGELLVGLGIAASLVRRTHRKR
jgi:MYXO-CTERM domain-containing protein